MRVFNKVLCREWFITVFSFFLITSCTQVTTAGYTKEESLRTIVDSLTSNVVWTSELDSSIVSASSSKIEGIGDSLSPSIDSIYMVYQDSSSPIYPHLEGLGVLDTSNIPKEALAILEKFCTCLCKDYGGDKFMDKEYIYSLMFFRMDIIEKFGKYPIFNNFIIAKPVENKNFYQCPVRLLGDDKNFIDINIYIEEIDSNWVVKQLELK